MRSSAWALSLACLLALVLTGCTLNTTAAPTAEAGAAISGIVHGGQNPIIGAHVYLFAANAGVFTPNTNGYGNASVSLLTAGTGRTQDTTPSDPTYLDYYVTTDSNGNFSITGDYSCTAGQQVYLYALGGNPGLGTGTNPAAGLMAALGNCPGVRLYERGFDGGGGVRVCGVCDGRGACVEFGDAGGQAGDCECVCECAGVANIGRGERSYPAVNSGEWRGRCTAG
jgi:hypothetical protein